MTWLRNIFKSFGVNPHATLDAPELEMNLLSVPFLIAPDSSHWADWLDAMNSSDDDVRCRAETLHKKMSDQGRIPFLSFHHVQELFGTGNSEKVRNRLSSLRSLPSISWARMTQMGSSIGTIADIFAAESVSYLEGNAHLVEVRDRAKGKLLRIGSGEEALAEIYPVWEMVRSDHVNGRKQNEMVSALSAFESLEKGMTVGEFSQLKVASPDAIYRNLMRIRQNAFESCLAANGGDIVRANEMAEEFISSVIEGAPPPNMSRRQMLERDFLAQGIDASEIVDGMKITDLLVLGEFRSKLKAISDATSISFDELKKVNMNFLPSHKIMIALRLHGQKREKRPASDVIDGFLSVLSAYCDVVFVDKRTAEDFRIVSRKVPELKQVLGSIRKAGGFDEFENSVLS